MLGLRRSVRPVSLLSKSLISMRFQSTASTKIPLNADPIPKIKPEDEIPQSYPEVKRELYYKRDPYGDWDDVQNRRNLNEPLHPDEDILNLWSPEYYDTVPDSTAVKWWIYFFSGIGIYAGFMYFFVTPGRRGVPRSYPHDGLSRAMGARDEKEADILGARIDKTAY